MLVVAAMIPMLRHDCCYGSLTKKGVKHLQSPSCKGKHG